MAEFAVFLPIKEVNDKTDGEPHDQPDPGICRQCVEGDPPLRRRFGLIPKGLREDIEVEVYKALIIASKIHQLSNTRTLPLQEILDFEAKRKANECIHNWINSTIVFTEHRTRTLKRQIHLSPSKHPAKKRDLTNYKGQHAVMLL